MTDRGEKIVSLAREMLSAQERAPLSCLDYARPPLTLKAVCLAVLLSSVSSGLVIHTIDEYYRPATRYEKVEIDALLYYATRQKNLSPQTLRHELEALLTLPSLEAMTKQDYKKARDFLLERIE